VRPFESWILKPDHAVMLTFSSVSSAVGDSGRPVISPAVFAFTQVMFLMRMLRMMGWCG